MAIEPFPHAAQGVVLRRLEPGDLAAFQAYRHDPEVGRYQGWTPVPDAEAATFLDEMQRARCFVPGAWFQVGIADIEAAALVGDIGLWVSVAGDTGEIGISLARCVQRSGIATRAMREAIGLLFAHTSIERVRAVTDARNAASIRLLERVGMRRVESRDAEFRGERCREHVYTVERPAPVA
ncbi:MAG: GNAT family N-acetyltransferase [Casimicrobiaceae bacterium]